VWDFDKYNFKDAGEFSNGFEELIKLKEKSGYLDLSEKELTSDLESLSYEQEELCSAILKKQSDEARAFHEYIKLMNQKIKYTSIMSLFGSEKEHHQLLSLNPSEILKKYKEYKTFMKRFIEEDDLIKQGLVKTK
jgi:hypothetical protein